jgi:hypothetical protein
MQVMGIASLHPSYALPAAEWDCSPSSKFGLRAVYLRRHLKKRFTNWQGEAVFAACIMAISASASAIDPAGSSQHRQGSDSDRRSGRVPELALRAFMSMNRAVAIVGPDGKLLQPNLIFEKLFGDSELLDRINREAGANNGKSDCKITLADGRAFWVETIPMDGGWLVSAYDMSERSAKERIDTLTKLGNRLMFHERLAQMLAKPDHAAEAAEAAAILVVDLDRFIPIARTHHRRRASRLRRGPDPFRARQQRYCGPARRRQVRHHPGRSRPAAIGGGACRAVRRPDRPLLALQLPFPQVSESMGNHDSNVVGAGRVC